MTGARQPVPPRQRSLPEDELARTMLAQGRQPAWLAATLIGGAALNALVVYQVPVTTRAGLPLGIAAAVARFRGLAQLAGRLPLTALTGQLRTAGDSLAATS